MPRESKRTQIVDEKTRESKRAQREEEKTRDYKRAHQWSRTALPQHRISQIDAERMQELTGNINPMLLQRSETAVREIIKHYKRTKQVTTELWPTDAYRRRTPIECGRHPGT